jgi:alpha-galactosidase
MASPLFAGNDLRIVKPETLKILTNKEIIAINQDKLGIQGFKYQSENGVDVWVKPLFDEIGRWFFLIEVINLKNEILIGKNILLKTKILNLTLNLTSQKYN